MRSAVGPLTLFERREHSENYTVKRLSLYRWAVNRKKKYGGQLSTQLKTARALYRGELRKGYASQAEVGIIESRRRGESP